MICSSLFLLSFNLNANKCLNSTNNLKLSPKENMVKAYVLIRNNWVSGYVFISNGYVTRVQFEDITDGYRVISRAQLYQKVPVSYLNPNNPMAINNNFTCFIDIPNYGKAYFTL
jgi:hypothetical protein